MFEQKWLTITHNEHEVLHRHRIRHTHDGGDGVIWYTPLIDTLLYMEVLCATLFEYLALEDFICEKCLNYQSK